MQVQWKILFSILSICGEIFPRKVNLVKIHKQKMCWLVDLITMRKRLVCYCCCYCGSNTATAAETTPSARGWSCSMYIFLTLLQIVVFHFTPGISDTVPPSTKCKHMLYTIHSTYCFPCKWKLNNIPFNLWILWWKCTLKIFAFEKFSSFF